MDDVDEFFSTALMPPTSTVGPFYSSSSEEVESGDEQGYTESDDNDEALVSSSDEDQEEEKDREAEAEEDQGFYNFIAPGLQLVPRSEPPIPPTTKTAAATDGKKKGVLARLKSIAIIKKASFGRAFSFKKNNDSATKAATKPPTTVQKREEVKEVDFYTNPTLLSRLILDQKFSTAIQRVARRPEEASVWVCAKRASNSGNKKVVYSLRELPIHMACACLFRTHDSELRKKVDKLLQSLIVAYPAGAFQPDLDGNLPVVEAVRYGATTETVTLLLLSDPAAVDRVDPKSGHTLSMINRYRIGIQYSPNTSMEQYRNKDDLQKLVDQPRSFWEQARTAVAVRLQGGNKRIMIPTAHVDDKNDEAYSPDPFFDQFDMSTIFSATTAAMLCYGYSCDYNSNSNKTGEGQDEEEAAEPLKWDQLKQRAIAVERKACDIKEENYELTQRLKQVTISRMELQNELNNNNTNADIAASKKMDEEKFAKLQTENEELNRRLEHMQALVECTIGLGGDESTMLDESIVSVNTREDSAEKQQRKYDKLFQRHMEQRQNVRVFRAAFTHIAEEKKENPQAVARTVARSLPVTSVPEHELHEKVRSLPDTPEQTPALQQVKETCPASYGKEEKPRWTPVCSLGEYPLQMTSHQKVSPTTPDTSESTPDEEEDKEAMETAFESDDDNLSAIMRAEAARDLLSFDSSTKEDPTWSAENSTTEETEFSDGSDDLDAIIRSAARGLVKSTSVVRKKPNRGIVAESVLACDNLDEILRFACAQELRSKEVAEEDSDSCDDFNKGRSLPHMACTSGEETDSKGSSSGSDTGTYNGERYMDEDYFGDDVLDEDEAYTTMNQEEGYSLWSVNSVTVMSGSKFEI